MFSPFWITQPCSLQPNQSNPEPRSFTRAWERRAKVRHHGGSHGSHRHVYDWLVKALDLFAEAIVSE